MPYYTTTRITYNLDNGIELEYIKRELEAGYWSAVILVFFQNGKIESYVYRGVQANDESSENNNNINAWKDAMIDRCTELSKEVI